MPFELVGTDQPLIDEMCSDGAVVQGDIGGETGCACVDHPTGVEGIFRSAAGFRYRSGLGLQRAVIGAIALW